MMLATFYLIPSRNPRSNTNALCIRLPPIATFPLKTYIQHAAKFVTILTSAIWPK